MLPELERQGIAAIGMKSLGGNGRAITKRAVTAEERAALRDEPAGVHDRVGDRVADVLRQNLGVARRLHADERTGSARPTSGAGEALDGRFELYKTSADTKAILARVTAS